MLSRLILLGLSLVTLQCQRGSNQTQRLNERSGVRPGTAYGPNADAVSSCAEGEQCSAYQPIEDEDAVADEPTSVAGAFLSCLNASDPDFLSCQVQHEGNPVRLPSRAKLEWTVSQGAESVPTTARIHDGLAAGTFFYVKKTGRDMTSVSLKVQEGKSSDTIQYALSRVPSDLDSVILGAMPVEEIPASSFESTGSFDILDTLGHGELSNENASCVGPVEGTVARPALTHDITYADEAGKVSLYADGVCGLAKSQVFMQLLSPPPARPILVKVVPNAGKVLLFKNFEMFPGPMSFTFGFMGSSVQDKVRLGSIRFVH